MNSEQELPSDLLNQPEGLFPDEDPLLTRDGYSELTGSRVITHLPIPEGGVYFEVGAASPEQSIQLRELFHDSEVPVDEWYRRFSQREVIGALMMSQEVAAIGSEDNWQPSELSLSRDPTAPQEGHEAAGIRRVAEGLAEALGVELPGTSGLPRYPLSYLSNDAIPVRAVRDAGDHLVLVCSPGEHTGSLSGSIFDEDNEPSGLDGYSGESDEPPLCVLCPPGDVGRKMPLPQPCHIEVVWPGDTDEVEDELEELWWRLGTPVLQLSQEERARVIPGTRLLITADASERYRLVLMEEMIGQLLPESPTPSPRGAGDKGSPDDREDAHLPAPDKEYPTCPAEDEKPGPPEEVGE